jgi:hypothetical protein
LAVLKELLGKDKDHVNLPLLVAFTKNFSYDVLGVKQTNVKKPVDVNVEEAKDEGISPQAVSVDEPLCGQELQEQFRSVVTKYFASVKSHIIRSHKVSRSSAFLYFPLFWLTCSTSETKIDGIKKLTSNPEKSSQTEKQHSKPSSKLTRN